MSSVPFNGFVLRKPRISSSNDPTTAEGDVIVRPQDRATYLSEVAYNEDATTTEYMVTVRETANLAEPDSVTETAQKVGEWVFQFNASGRSVESVLSVTPTPDTVDIRAGLLKYNQDPAQDVVVEWEPARLKINWTKNDLRTRFGFNDAFQRWTPLPGAAPEQLGLVEDSKLLSLPTVEQGDPLLVIGSPDQDAGTAVPVLVQVSDPQFQEYVDGTLTVPVGEAVLNTDNGDLLFADDVVTGFLNQPVYFFRKSFFTYDESTGAIGKVEDDLYMNPIPNTTESPRIRIQYRSYLVGQHSTTSTTPDPGYDYVWSSNTGAIYLDSAIIATQEGESVYYNGVFSNSEPVDSYAHEELGPILLGANSAFSTTGLFFDDVSAWDLEHTILYVRETGESIADIEIVETEGDLELPMNLPPTRAQVARDTGAVQLSLSFNTQNEDFHLMAGTGDFPIENGISFRLSPSPIDPSNTRGIADGKGVSRVANEVLASSIPAGPSFLVNQLPLRDIAGYDDDIFYRASRGPQKRLLQPDTGVVYDFDGRQLRWVQQETHNKVIPAPTYVLQLPHQALHDRAFSFELNTGTGFELLEEGDDVLLDMNSGLITLIERFGEPLFEDVGRLIGPDTLEATTADFTGLQIPVNPLKAPLMLIGSDVYRVIGSTASTITVDRPIDLAADSAKFQIVASPEIVFRYALEEASLRDRSVFPFIVTPVTTHAPEGSVFEFVVGDDLQDHILLEPVELGSLGDSLELPAHYQDSAANFDLYREEVLLTFTAAALPAPGEYGVSGSDLVFNTDDEVAFEGAPILLDPALSDQKATGLIEILASTRELNVPTDIDSPDLLVRTLVPEDGYRLQGSLLFFERPFRSGQRLLVRYTDSAGDVVEENVGFRVLENIGAVDANSPVKSFGAGRDIDAQRPVTVKVNGHPSGLSANISSGTINTSSQRRGRRVEASYYALESEGGEQTVSLLDTPTTPPVVFEEGVTQTFAGNHTNTLSTGTFLQAGPQSFVVETATFDGENTQVELSSPILEALREPQVFVSTDPIADLVTVPTDIVANSAGTQEVQVLGNFSNFLKTFHVLFLDGDPYYIQQAEFNEGEGYTRVTVATELYREYDAPTIEVSEDPVYPPETPILNTAELALPNGNPTLIRFGADGAGHVVEDYTLEGSGRLILEPATVASPTKGEVWYLAYTSLRSIGPRTIAGRTFLPRFRATYSRFVNATEENGLLGATLEASFDFEDPDTFFFRAVRLEEYAAEVAQQIDADAAASSSSGGPVISTAGSQGLHEKGNEGLIYEEANIRDQDRVGREYIQYYNDVIALFESLLEIIDGRVVGDRDGKFLFRLRPDDAPGGIDPVSGELIPYYVNSDNPGSKPASPYIKELSLEDQVGYVENFIDDILVVSKKPVELGVGIPISFDFLGTFKPAWQAHRLSRLYPEQRRVFTVTLPTENDDDDEVYTFLSDFRKLLADIKQEAVLSVDNIRPRAAKARISEAGNFGPSTGDARFYVAMNYDPDTGEMFNENTPSEPVPSEYIPAFEVGNHVSMGRVTYVKNIDGTFDRTTDIYAQNMIVTAVGADYIEVEENSDGPFDGLELTDPSTVSPQKGDTIYTVPPMANSSFIVGEDVPPFYSVPTDLSVNAADGELINNTLPSFFATILGQSPLTPSLFLDLTVNFKNQQTEPTRFPALDGGLVDDDGDHRPPFIFPIQDSELQRIEAEQGVNQDVVDQTTAGVVLGDATILDTVTIEVSDDLTLLTPIPGEFDLLLIQDLVDGQGDSVEFSVQSVSSTRIHLAAFVLPVATVNFELDNLYSGLGEWNAIDSLWEDANTDFRDFAGGVPGLTLHVGDGAGGYSEYDVIGVEDGYLETSTTVMETDPSSYFLSLDAVGEIPATIDRIELADVDFSNATGTVVVSSASSNNGSYQAAGGGVGFLYVEVLSIPAGTTDITLAISNGAVIGSGNASVDVVGPVLTLEDSNDATNVEVGQTLIIPSSTTAINAGRYLVVDVEGNEITVDRALQVQGDSGALTFPVGWEVTNPRRFSPYLDVLREELVRQRITYISNDDAPVDIASDLTAISSNPSTPYKDRIEELKDLLFGDPLLSVTGGSVTAPDQFEGVDFVSEGVEAGDFVVVEAGTNRGFYPVIDVDGTGSTALVVSDTNEFVIYSLTTASGVDFKVYRASQFTPKTYHLVLYEYLNILAQIERLNSGIRVTKHNPLDFFGDVGTLEERPGDPTDDTLEAHRIFNGERLLWIRDDAPNLRQEIEATLKGREALYDIRYTWIDYRTNLEEGTLPRRVQFNRQKEKRQRKLLKDLIKQLST